MDERGETAAPAAPPEQRMDPGVMFDTWREHLAERFDPVRFRFIEALARRAAAHQGEARRILDAKLAKALHEYRERLDKAKAASEEMLAHRVRQFPHAADALRQMHAAGDFRELSRFIANLANQGGKRDLADLVDYIGQHSRESAAGASMPGLGENGDTEGELKSLRYFRNTWSKLSVDRKLTQAFAQAPENAGPLNAHHLVLQSLKRMRDISPEYLMHFMSYVDALLWLDQADSGRRTDQKNVGRGERDKKRKSARGKPGGN